MIPGYMKRSRRSSWTAFLGLAASTSALASVTVTFERVASTGDPVPGRNPPLNAVFNGRAFQASGAQAGVLSRPSINSAGVVVFRGVGSAPGNFNANTTIGIYVWTPAGSPVELVGEQYTNGAGATFTGITYPVPGRPAGTKFTNFSPPLINDRGDVVFRASYGGSPGSGDGYYATTIAGGPIVKIIDTNDTVPGYPGTVFNQGLAFESVASHNQLISLNDNGEVAFVAPFKRASDPFIQTGIFGSTVAGGPGVLLVDSTGTIGATNESSAQKYYDIQNTNGVALNNTGIVMFVGGIGTSAFGAQRGVHAVPVAGSSLPTRLARAPLTAPALLDSVARSYSTSFGGYDLNDGGEYIFQNVLSGGTTNALFKGTLPAIANGVVLGNIAPPVGTSVPGRAAAVKFTDISSGPLNEAGQIGTQANDNGLANGQGVYALDVDGSSIRLVAQNPAIPPGRASGAFGSFDGRAATINNSGNMALSPNATDIFAGSPDSVFGLYFYDNCSSELSRLFDRDTSAAALPLGLGKIFVAPGCGGSPCERDVRLWQGFETRAGHYRSMNDANDVAFLAAFSTFDVGVYVAHVQTSGGAVQITCPPPATVECGNNIAPINTGTATASGCGTITVTSSDSTPTPICGNAYSFIRTWTATNGTTSASCDQLISVIDTTDPILTLPQDVGIECNESSDPSNTGVASATDACGPTPAVTYADVTTAGACPNQQVITRTWTATDACGNSMSGQQIISVGDTNLAVLSVPADVTIACGASTDPSNTGSASAVDACDADPSITYADSVTNGSCAAETTVTRTWTATDACGNVTSAMQTITVVDDAGPTLTLPSNASLGCGDSTDTGDTGSATAIDNCGGNPTVNYTDSVLAGACPAESWIFRTWSAQDECGNISTGTQVIALSDTTPPTLTVPADATVECTQSTSTAALGTATATDNCTLAAPSVTFADTEISGNCPQNRTIQRTWTASDECGNHASQVQTIHVTDSGPPTLVVPADITIACGDSADVLITGNASASDACDGAPMVSFNDTVAPGTCPYTSVLTRVWTASDACGNSTSGAQHISLIDDVAPSITCPPDVQAEATAGNCEAGGLDIGFAIATDNCSEVTIANDAPAVFPVGVTYVTWTATDACGLSQSCVQTVTVDDPTPPVICAWLWRVMLWPPNHDLEHVGLWIHVADECGQTSEPVITVYADEDDQEPTGDGVHSPDAKDLGCGGVRLRAERKGNGNGRVYLIVIEATDDSGNAARTCCTVVVPHSRAPLSLLSVMQQAAAATAFFNTTGLVPPGYVLVGDGPVIGPKQ